MNSLTFAANVIIVFYMHTLFILILFSDLLFAQPVNFHVQVNKKTIPAGEANYNFGYDVAVDSTTLMVGAPGVNSSKGAVCVYSKNTFGWQQTQVLTDPNAEPNEFFGNSIDLYDNTAVIGAYGRSVVLIFQKVGGIWTYLETISPSLGYGRYLEHR